MEKKESLLNLAAQVLNGDLAGPKEEENIQNQVMRLWRGVEFAAPGGRVLALMTADEIEEVEAARRRLAEPTLAAQSPVGAGPSDVVTQTITATTDEARLDGT